MYAKIREAELLCLSQYEGHLSIPESSPKVQFFGYLFRGLAIKGSRDHRWTLSKAAQTRLKGETGRSAAEIFKRLAEVYLSHFGAQTTINNLLLEAEEEKRRLNPTHATQCMRISLNTARSEVLLNNSTQVVITLSRAATSALGVDQALWNDVQILLSKDPEASAPKPEDRLIKLEQNIKNCWAQLARHEPEFIHGIGCLVAGDEAVAHPMLVGMRALPTWIKALQGLALLLRATECDHWISIPVVPEHSALLKTRNLTPPLCAFTAFTTEPLQFDHFKELSDSVHNAWLKDPQHSKVRNTFAEAMTRGNEVGHGTNLNNTSPEEWAAIKKIRAVAGCVRNIPALPQLLSLAKSLIGTQHEGDPQSFVLLCAPEAFLIRAYPLTSSGGTELTWFLRKQFELCKADFPPVGAELEVTSYSVGAKEGSYSMKANSLLLQEPGYALFFPPIPGDFHPTHAVQFQPFDPARLDRMLEVFTEQEKGGAAVAIHVRSRDAVLFVDGKKVASCTKEWKEHKGQGGAADLADKILSRMSGLLSTKIAEDLLNARVKSVCETVALVAGRHSGALFFLDAGSDVNALTLGPVWGTQTNEGKSIDCIKPELLASIAGLDGETHINLITGKFHARQFLEPGVNANDAHPLNGAHTAPPNWTEEFRRRWVTSRDLNPEMDEFAEVHRFGTRHRKALRVTLAYPSILAITISADGPIRLWQHGIPFEKF